jgi:hypothetical protein
MAFVIEDDAEQPTSGRFVIEDNTASLSPLEQLDIINGAVNPAHARPAPERTALQKITDPLNSVIEPVMTIGSGMVAAPIANIIGAGREILTGDFGRGTGERTAGAVQSTLTYQPRSPGAQENLATIGEAFDKSKLAGLPMAGQELPMLGQAIRQQLPYVGIKAGAAGQQYAARQAAKEAAKYAGIVEKSSSSIPKIDAARKAADLGIVINPAEANPTTMNRIKSGVAGAGDIGVSFSIKNEPKWAAIAKEDLGIPKEKSLTINSFKEARQAYSAPYEKISEIKTIPTDAQYLSNIKGGNFLEGLPPQEQALLVGSKKVDQLIRAASLNEFTGQGAIELIKQFRKDANKVIGLSADPKQLALANAKLKIASELESNIGRQLDGMHKLNPSAGYDQLSSQLKAAREYYAKSYTYQNATNLATGKLDPMKIAKLASSDNPMTGKLKDIGDIAANFPLSSRVGLEESMTPPKILRSSIGGTIGAGIGGAVGGYPGLLAGGALGFGTEVLLEKAIKNSLASRSSQLSNLPAYPTFRQQMGYEPYIPPSNGMLKP